MIIGIGLISFLKVNIYKLSIMFSIVCCMKYLKKTLDQIWCLLYMSMRFFSNVLKVAHEVTPSTG